MDKYEEAALAFKETYPMMGEMEGFLSAAFRWYEDKYLAEALTAAVLMREKETCEWRYERHIGWRTECGGTNPYTGYVGKRCSFCGRRIVEVSK